MLKLKLKCFLALICVLALGSIQPASACFRDRQPVRNTIRAVIHPVQTWRNVRGQSAPQTYSYSPAPKIVQTGGCENGQCPLVPAGGTLVRPTFTR